MAEFPAMPLWTDAYLADAGHLTTLEHGAYLLLLMTMWRNGGVLPNDDKRLARFARLSGQQWQRIKPTIMEFFDVEGDEITQGRLTAEYAFVKQKREGAKNSANAKWLKTNKTGYANASKSQSERNAPTPTPINNKYADFLGGIRGTVFLSSTSDEYAAWHDWARKHGHSLPNINGGYWFKTLHPPADDQEDVA